MQTTKDTDGAPALQVTVTNWAPARRVFAEFLKAHPELGLKYSENTFKNFSRIHGPALIDQDVMRKPGGLRSPAIVDCTRFDEAAFELISNSASQKKKKTG
jgi:hypothetical protein